MNKAFLAVLFIFLAASGFSQSLEIPFPEGDVYSYKGFTLQYNEKYEQADWVAYELTAEEVKGKIRRSNRFRSDPRIETGSSSLKDYRKSGYARGHLAPAADMKWSEQAMDESFYMSNMSPQNAQFNSGIWKNLEELARKWALDNEKILVATGPVITGNYKVIGDNQVAVPAYFYKVIMDITGPSLKGIGFIIPNEDISAPLSSFAVSIDDVEMVTGLDFFYLVNPETQEILESSFAPDSWEWQ